MAKRKTKVESVTATLATGTKVTGPKGAIAKLEKRAEAEVAQAKVKAEADRQATVDAVNAAIAGAQASGDNSSQPAPAGQSDPAKK